VGDFADDACHREMDQWLGEIEEELEDSDRFPPTRRSRPLGPGSCPKCGADTILRNGSHGQFYGCSTFPKCKGSRNVAR